MANPFESKARTLPKIPKIQLAKTRPKAQLNPKDLEYLMLLAQGLRDSEISKELGVTVGTVRNRMFAIYQKLGVRTRTEAALKFLSFCNCPDAM